MALSLRDHAAPLVRLLVGQLTLGLFGALAGIVALVQLSVLPDYVMLVGSPAVLATLLVDTALFDALAVDAAGLGFWTLFVLFAYVQAVVVSGFFHGAQRYAIPDVEPVETADLPDEDEDDGDGSMADASDDDDTDNSAVDESRVDASAQGTQPRHDDGTEPE